MYLYTKTDGLPVLHRTIVMVMNNTEKEMWHFNHCLASGRYDVNEKTQFGDTALMVAILVGHLEIATTLAHLAMIDETNRHGQTASLLAMQYGMPVVASILISRGENITIRDQFEHDYFYYIIRNGEYHRYLKLKNNPAIDLNQHYDGMSLTALAARYGHFLLVYDLLDQGIPFQSERYELTLMDCAVAADEAGYVRDWLAHDGAQDEQAKMKYLKSATKHASHLCFTALLEAMTLNEEQLKILFVVASSNNNAVAFNQLLPFWKEMDVPVTDAGDTLLHLALKQGTLETIAALIQRGAKATVTNHAGKTAFHLALENETKDELIFLFQSVPAKDWPLTLWDIPRTKIPRMWNLFVLEQYKKQLPCKPSGYFQSVSHVTSTVASFFYNEGAKIRTLWHYYFSEPELTPLHNEMKYATGDDEESVTKVRQLLEIYSVNARNKKGETPLMLAAAKNRVDLMPLLLSHGADLDAMDEQFQTPLHHAASKDALQAYLFLLTITRKKQVKNINGYTPLLLAIKHGVARGQLISATARDHRIDTEKNNQGLSAIHLAAIVGLSPWRLQTLSLYVPVTLEGPNKVTALHLAASCGRLDVITLLIEQGANVEALDTHGNSMLEYMMCSKNDKIFHQFKYLLQLQNEARATCFFRAVASADFTTPLCDPRIFEAAQNHVGIQGTTMLHLCAVHNAHAVARLYVAQKPEQLDVADHFGNTALHYAALTNSKDVMRVLSEHKEHLPVNKLNHEHQTALFIACDNGHAEVCECLILLGADATIPDALGITPAQTALLKGHIPIAETLLQCGDHSLAPSRLAQLPDFVRTKIQEKYSRELAELQRIPVPERGLLQVLGLNQGASSSSSSQETNSRLAGPNRSFN